MKRFQKGLKRQGYKVVKRKFPNKKRGHATIVVAPNISLPNVHMRSKITSIRRTRKKTRLTIERSRSTWKRLTLAMNRTQLERAQVKRMRRLQP
jgi:hypothetical protein